MSTNGNTCPERADSKNEAHRKKETAQGTPVDPARRPREMATQTAEKLCSPRPSVVVHLSESHGGKVGQDNVQPQPWIRSRVPKNCGANSFGREQDGCWDIFDPD